MPQKLEELKKERVKWIDCVKCLGIWAIYLGHFGNKAGIFYPFVFMYHVPLFFFISGCMECYSTDTFLKYAIKKVKRILVPFYIFAASSILFNLVIYRKNFCFTAEPLLVVAKGCVRNSFFASSL